MIKSDSVSLFPLPTKRPLNGSSKGKKEGHSRAFFDECATLLTVLAFFVESILPKVAF